MKNAGHRTGLGVSFKKASALTIRYSSNWSQKISAIDMWQKWTSLKRSNSSWQNKWPNSVWLKSERLRQADLRRRKPRDFSKCNWRKAISRGQVVRGAIDQQKAVKVTFKITLLSTKMEAVLTWTRARTPSKLSHFLFHKSLFCRCCCSFTKGLCPLIGGLDLFYCNRQRERRENTYSIKNDTAQLNVKRLDTCDNNDDYLLKMASQDF